jgi:hypothetical protein
MASDHPFGETEKAEEVDPSMQRTIRGPAVALAHEILQPSSSHSKEPAAEQDDARYLEELAAVSTGPVYSDFSTAQKRFIVAMVSSIFLFQSSLQGLDFQEKSLKQGS